MKIPVYALAACAVALLISPGAGAQSGKVRTASAPAEHYNPEAPVIINDYACVKVCEGTRSSCDPTVYEKAGGRCS